MAFFASHRRRVMRTTFGALGVLSRSVAAEAGDDGLDRAHEAVPPEGVVLLEELDEAGAEELDGEVNEPSWIVRARLAKQGRGTTECAASDGCAAECSASDCEEPRSGAPRVWIGGFLIQDAAFVSGENVCTAAGQIDGGYVCLREQGTQYHGTPLSGAAGSIQPGFVPATTRLAGAALVPAGRTSLGLRIGWAVAGRGPRPNGGDAFLPVSAEGRLAWWFSGEALSTEKVGVFALVSAGLAQVDGGVGVEVEEDPSAPPPIAQLDNPPAQRLTAYQRAGPWFAGTGLGAFLPLGGSTGVMADLRVMALLPSSGIALSLGVGVVSGL